MQVLFCTKPGVLAYKEMEKPVPQAGQSLLKIKRIGICGTDLHAYEGTQPFFEYPRILGHELAAEYVKGDAANFKAGDSVTIIPYFYCGQCVACRQGKPNCCVSIKVCGVHQHGGMAEYLAVPSYALLHSEGLLADELALVEPLAIGAHAVRRAEIRKDEFVLVMGAGPIGLGIMELARIAGANVIAMDNNPQRLSFCAKQRSAAFFINPGNNDPLTFLKEITHNQMPAVVIDATGNRQAINNGFEYIAHGGRYILVGLQKGDISFSHPEFHKREATLMSSRNATRADFQQVMTAIKNKLVDPTGYITHRVSFDNVKEAFTGWLDPTKGVIKAMVTME
jgi:2-desacetyl-2-hydroxyethyl bacteriochlorophyllide A dehydrogenase